MGFAGAHPSCFRVSGIVKESPVYCRTTLERRGSQFTSHACFWDCGRKSNHPARTHRHRENIQTPEGHRLGDRHHNPTAVENTSRSANISCDKLQKTIYFVPWLFIWTFTPVSVQILPLFDLSTLICFVSFVGGIPPPIYFGALIDRTCLKWGTKQCGGRGACRLYDANKFRYSESCQT